MFETGIIETPYYYTSVQNHALLKPRILEAIASMQVSRIEDHNDVISNGDYYAPYDMPRPYIPLIKPLYDRACTFIVNRFGMAINHDVSTIWYQQYGLKDTHSWHSHHTFYSAIYYVELPSDAALTTVHLGDREMDIPAKEGMLVVLPGSLLHASKPNPSNERKTIIAFNIQLRDHAA